MPQNNDTLLGTPPKVPAYNPELLDKAIAKIEETIGYFEKMLKDSHKPWPERREYDYEDVAVMSFIMGQAILEALKVLRGQS